MVSERALAARLRAGGIEAAAFEAAQLLAASPDGATLEDRVTRRLRGEPLQYLLGEWEFWGVTLAVGEGVLIPRPDTEVLVEEGLAALQGAKAPRVLDLCAGSGCVALALAKERPDAAVTALEWDPAAYAYLEKNIAALGSEVTPVRADVLAPPPVGMGPFDLITANPPYLTAEEMAALSPEVRREPPQALLGGEDGLAFYRAIRDRWLPLLAPGGALALEIGWKQAADVCGIFAPYAPRVRKDYGGNDRVVTLRI